MNHLYDGLLGGKSGDRMFAKIPGTPTRYYSYDNVRDVSGRLAALLVSLGVRPGHRVAAQVPKSVEALMLYLGIIRAGAAFLPLNTAYTKAEVDYFLSDAEPSLFVCAPDDEAGYRPLAEGLGIHLETLGVYTDDKSDAGSLLAACPPEGTPFDTVAREPDDLAGILYTSGTTGRSKGAMLSHNNLLSNALTLADLWRFTDDDRLIHALPIFHTHGLFVATNVILAAGGSLIFLPRFDPDAVLAAMDAGATAMMGVPTFYTRLLDHPGLTREATANMRLFVSGSAPLLAEAHERWSERTGHAILERYGMTETNMNTSNPYDGERRAGTVGQPLPGVEVIVTGEDGTALPTGEIGSIEVRGPNVFGGYWRMPEKTAEEKRENGFFITGDLGVYSDDGYLTIVGRSKDLIISGGFNVYPKEVEALIDELDGVKESAVVGLPHPDFGEGVVAVVVAQEASLDESAVLSGIGDQLARYKQPKHVFFVEELPRNTMGKVQKNVLRERYSDTFG